MRKELLYYQETLPRTELLEVYIETRQRFLGPIVSQTLTNESATKQANQGITWTQWLRITQRPQQSNESSNGIGQRQNSPKNLTVTRTVADQDDSQSSDDSSDAFFDVEEDTEHQLTSQEPSPSTFEGNIDDEFVEVEEIAQRPIVKMIEATASKDLVGTLLAAEGMVIEILISLESASVLLQV